MVSVYTRIFAGEIPARFVWKDEVCAAFLDIQPLRPGHVLVVPRVEVDHWLDIDADLAAHLMRVAHAIGRAQQAVFRPARVGLMIAGMGVPHVHLHIVPFDSVAELSFANADPHPAEGALDAAAEKIRTALRAQLDPARAEHVSY